MKSLKKLIKPELIKILPYGKREINDQLTTLFDRKMNRPSAPSYFLYHLHRYIIDCARAEGCSIRPLEKEVREKYLSFVFEVVMSMNDLRGQILNKRQCPQDAKSIPRDIIDISILKDRVYDYIDDHFDGREAPVIQSYTRTIFRCMDLGWYFDQFDTYKSLVEGESTRLTDGQKPADVVVLDAVEEIISHLQQFAKTRKEAVRTYFERSYLLNAAFYRFGSEMLMDLMGYNGRERKNIMQFAECYGLLSQLVDDNCDYVPRSESAGTASSILNDLKNQVITLSVLLHLEEVNGNGSSLVKTFLKTKDAGLIENRLNELLREMITSQALLHAIQSGKAIAQQAKYFLNEKNAAFSDLAALLSIGFDNECYGRMNEARRSYMSGSDRDRFDAGTKDSVKDFFELKRTE